MPSIYVTLPYFDNKEALRILENTGDVTIRSEYPRPEEDELASLVQDYDILIIGVQEKMTPKVYDHASRTRIIATLSTGLDHIADEFLNDAAFDVRDTSGANAGSVGEFALLLTLSILKQLPRAQEVARKGVDRSNIGSTYDIRRSTIGLAGAGATAMAALDGFSALNGKILCWTRNPDKHPRVREESGEFVEWETLFEASDIVSLHLPLVEDTKGIVAEKELELLGNRGILINTARAGIVDNQTAFEMVEEDRLWGVGIDDFPDAIGVDIPEHDRVIVTPHIAGASDDALEIMQIEAAKGVSAGVTA